MRIQFCQSSDYGGIRHARHIDSINIVLLNLLQDKVKLAPTVIVSVETLLFPHFCEGESQNNSQDNAQECCNDIRSVLHILLYLLDLNTCPPEQIDTVSNAIGIAIHYPLDTGLDYKFSTLDTWRGCNIKGCIIAAVAGLCDLSYSISLGMENVWFCNAVLILTDILKPGWSTVVSIRDDHSVLDNQRAHLTTLAV